MKEIPEDKLEEVLLGNAENLNLEFKATFDFVQNYWMREKLIRSILAMANTRTGGSVVIGIETNEDKSSNFAGIKDSHMTLLISKEEELKAMVESFSSSPVKYEIGKGKFRTKDLILITVEEFFLNPSICRKDGKQKINEETGKLEEGERRILEQGAIYIRTLKDKPSSVKLIDPVDIQDILERSVDKRIIDLHKRGWSHDVEESESDKALFEKERANFK